MMMDDDPDGLIDLAFRKRERRIAEGMCPDCLIKMARVLVIDAGKRTDCYTCRRCDFTHVETTTG